MVSPSPRYDIEIEISPPFADKYVAIKILEDITDNIEEIEEEYLVLRDLCLHPNIPQFYGMFFRPGRKRDDDQLWFVMEVRSGHYNGVGISRGWGVGNFDLM